MASARTIITTPPCPRCGSEKTGVIRPACEAISARTTVRDLKSALHVRYVSMAQYKEYYAPLGVGLFCTECGYEFCGTGKREKVSAEEFEEVTERNGTSELLGRMLQKKPRRGIFWAIRRFLPW